MPSSRVGSGPSPAEGRVLYERSRLRLPAGYGVPVSSPRGGAHPARTHVVAGAPPCLRAGSAPQRASPAWLDSADVAVVGSILLLILNIFLVLMLIRLVVDWVQVFARSWTPHGAVLFVLEIVYSITDPPIMFVRRFVPPLRLGAVALDTSFIIVLIAV